jgi:hypothetical protein
MSLTRSAGGVADTNIAANSAAINATRRRLYEYMAKYRGERRLEPKGDAGVELLGLLQPFRGRGKSFILRISSPLLHIIGSFCHVYHAQDLESYPNSSSTDPDASAVETIQEETIHPN